MFHSLDLVLRFIWFIKVIKISCNQIYSWKQEIWKKTWNFYFTSDAKSFFLFFRLCWGWIAFSTEIRNFYCAIIGDKKYFATLNDAMTKKNKMKNCVMFQCAYHEKKIHPIITWNRFTLKCLWITNKVTRYSM